jgi:hypothetical protein
MSAQSFPRLGPRLASSELHLTGDFLCRAVLVLVFVTITHQLRWEWLRFLTSEAILRMSPWFGIAIERVSFDTILARGTFFRFVVACTFVDVFMGSVPLLWNLSRSLLRNLCWLVGVAAILFSFNLVRLEIGQILYARGVSWTFADEVLGGFAYFSVWIVIWRLRSWHLFGSKRTD